MYDLGPYREWADVLNDWKCGGRPEPEWRTVTIGDTYDIYWCGHYEETRTVTQNNKAWFERQLNDPENDVWTLERVAPADEKEGGYNNVRTRNRHRPRRNHGAEHQDPENLNPHRPLRQILRVLRLLRQQGLRTLTVHGFGMIARKSGGQTSPSRADADVQRGMPEQLSNSRKS